MKVKDKIKSPIEEISDLPYAYIVGGSGVYIKRITLCVHRKSGNFSWHQLHKVELYYLGATGKESERLYGEVDLLSFKERINKGEFTPIEVHNGVQQKLLPQRIPMDKAIVANNRMVLVDTRGRAYVGTISRQMGLPTGWFTCKAYNINRSSKGWSMRYSIFPDANTQQRIRFTLANDFRFVTKEELMEILV